jgi:hypothetical protein
MDASQQEQVMTKIECSIEEDDFSADLVFQELNSGFCLMEISLKSATSLPDFPDGIMIRRHLSGIPFQELDRIPASDIGRYARAPVASGGSFIGTQASRFLEEELWPSFMDAFRKKLREEPFLMATLTLKGGTSPDFMDALRAKLDQQASTDEYANVTASGEPDATDTSSPSP